MTVQVRHCIKCGREVGPDESMCAVCLRAGMTPPSASQYHATVAVAIVAAVAALAIAASLSLRGIGPYDGMVHGFTPDDPVGYTISYSVTNEGTKAGRAKCQLIAIGDSGQRLRTRNTVTEPIEGGETLELETSIPGLQEEPANVQIDCS